MITQAIQVTIFVENQAEAKQFYTDKLGFVVRDAFTFSGGFSYLTVAPNHQAETVIELVEAETKEEKDLIGRQAGEQIIIMFKSDNIDKDYRDMSARGVTFHGEPTAVPGGKGVGFEDLCGNKLDLFQPDHQEE